MVGFQIWFLKLGETQRLNSVFIFVLAVCVTDMSSLWAWDLPPISFTLAHNESGKRQVHATGQGKAVAVGEPGVVYLLHLIPNSRYNICSLGFLLWQLAAVAETCGKRQPQMRICHPTCLLTAMILQLSNSRSGDQQSTSATKTYG